MSIHVGKFHDRNDDARGNGMAAGGTIRKFKPRAALVEGAAGDGQ